tara:strand:+ start:1240 stop:1437 length:198 start_codon:yes stop_codon:yes gene_type:complete
VSEVIVFFVERRTREFTIETLPEKQIRKINRIERVFDFMLTGNYPYIEDAARYIIDGYPVYRVID